MHTNRSQSWLYLGVLLVALPGLAVQNAAPVAPVEYLREHYIKHEFRIAMRDGVRLFTAVSVPKDESKSYPILLNRTPYGVLAYGASTTAPRDRR